MKIIFAGRDNNFNRKFLREVSDEHELLCCLFLEPNRFQFANRCAQVRKRIRRYGLIRAVNELAFVFCDRLYLRKPETKLIYTRPEYFLQKTELPCPTYNVENIHDTEWLELVERQSPDIIFSVCCNVIFRPALYSIPRLGTFVLHEGLTPEYKGLHTALWALMKGDYQKVGYTLLKVTDDIDGGDVLVQGTYKLQCGESWRTWGWVGHNALIEGLADIKKSLKQLERAQGFRPVEVANREAHVYTRMTLTEFLGLLWRHTRP
jgi:hypothetical protein